MSIHNWHGLQPMQTARWTCGHCGLAVGGNLGYYRNDGMKPSPHHQPQPGGPLPANVVDATLPRIFICPNCAKPTYFEGGKQVPGVPYGVEIANLPKEVDNLYREARNCMAVSAFTAAVLATRKLLMNVAVSQGAKQGDSFQSYVTYLATNGYVPPNAKGWVDHIRDKGNEATHEIPAIGEPDAKDLITFMEMILKLVFDYPSRVPGHGPPPPAKPS